jgi:cell wall assembly regulator SMI1
MTELESIWQKPIYLPYLQPKLTNEILEKAENKLGYKLPMELIELLKIQNGGYIRKRLEESLNEQIYGIGPHFPSLTDVDWTDYKDWVSFELKGLIPFDGDGHWNICLDYRKNNENPQVTYISIESDSQRLVAKSFSEYLSQLDYQIDDELVIRTDKAITEITKELEKTLNIKFEKPDNYSQGYDEYRSQLDGSWIWLSPNLVPNGFVREDEDRYEELVELSKGTALRFPEISNSDLLISFSSKAIEKKAVEKLALNSIDVRPLTELIKK